MITYEQDINTRIENALEMVCNTRKAVIGCGNIRDIAKYYKQSFAEKEVVVVADQNTYIAAGKTIMSILSSDTELKVLKPFVFEEEIHAEYKYVLILEEFLRSNNAVPIAVGSGTINDLVKLASHNCGREYMIFPTAASVDGYTSYGASITKDNYKQTIDCPAPVAVMADIDIIASAPAEMNGSGYADLIAKIPAGADWIIADAIGIDHINENAWEMLQNNIRKWVGNPEGIKNREQDALTSLMEGLVISGFAMQHAMSSRPASGAEHIFSHVLDNHNYTYNGNIPFHGVKVGIGSVAVEAAYEKLMAMETEKIDVDKITASRPDWKEVEKKIRGLFQDRVLAEQVVNQSRKKYVDTDDFISRWKYVKLLWPEIKMKLGKQLYGSENLKNALRKAGAPYVPNHIGLDNKTFRESFQKARFLRERYTVLDFIFEAGMWNECLNPEWESCVFKDSN